MNHKSLIHDIIDLFVSFYDGEKSDKLESFLYDLSKREHICKNYSAISKVIYSLSPENLEKLEIFCGINSNDSISSFNFEGYLDSMKLNEKDKDNLQHFERHIVLSCLQRQYIDDITKDVSTEVDNAKSRVTRIYSEFVGILGVFTALSFALMGSVQVFGNILNNINNPTIGNIGYVLIVGGVYLILIYLVIMTLFIGMGKVFNKDSRYQFDKCFTGCIMFVSGVLIVFGLLFVYFG